jgi:hypothetical protein
VSDDDLAGWISGLPEGWAPPAELAEPTNSTLVNLVILVLTSPFTSNAVNERAAMLLAEKERFTTWFLADAKARLDERRLLELSELSGRLVEPCWTAWKAFVALFGSGKRPSGSDYQVLFDAFQRSADGYRALRT